MVLAVVTADTERRPPDHSPVTARGHWIVDTGQENGEQIIHFFHNQFKLISTSGIWGLIHL